MSISDEAWNFIFGTLCSRRDAYPQFIHFWASSGCIKMCCRWQTRSHPIAGSVEAQGRFWALLLQHPGAVGLPDAWNRRSYSGDRSLLPCSQDLRLQYLVCASELLVKSVSSSCQVTQSPGLCLIPRILLWCSSNDLQHSFSFYQRVSSMTCLVACQPASLLASCLHLAPHHLNTSHFVAYKCYVVILLQ